MTGTIVADHSLLKSGGFSFGGCMQDPITVADLAHYGVLEKLDSYIKNDGRLGWQDVQG